MKYLEGLNEAQRRAVLTVDGPVSVIAGAGAGKTRVLTSRVYHLIREGVLPSEILAVTFTNKAAREMRARLGELLKHSPDVPASADEPFVATFHGLGRFLLETYGAAIDVPRRFSVYDRDDSEKVIARALKALDIEAKELSPRAVLGRISRAKGEGMTMAEFSERNASKSFSGRVVAEVWRRYETGLRAERALDFDDLITLPVRLLEEHADVRSSAQRRWRYVHIDEYQDTNDLQERLISLLAARSGNVFVVGDADQAIYGWRGANMEHILRFTERYAGAQQIVLETNYRSSRSIVDASNAIIEKNTKRLEKRSTTENLPGEPVRITSARSAEEEARTIAREAGRLIRGGLNPEQIAVLYRTNFQSRALEEGFLAEGIPYKLLGTHFFERKEVKDMLAWMRLALDPSRESDRVRAAGSPPRGIGRLTLAKLAAGERDKLRAGEATKVAAFEAVVAELAAAVELLAPSAFVKLAAEKSGMRRALLEEGSPEDRERYENIVELAAVATRYDRVVGADSLNAFLADAALSGDQDELDQGNASRVALMTVHAAKGLEFDTVFVAGMEEGLFPHQGLGNDKERDEEEERRLFYVAMTRAKRRLVLTFARMRTLYGERYFPEPSSFLADLPRELVAYDERYAEEEIIEA